MDAVSLAFSVILTGSAVAVLSLFLAAVRGKRGLWIFSASFISAVAAFFLFTVQRRLHPWIGMVLPNALLVFHLYGLVWSLRSCVSLTPSWPKRLWAYSGLWLSSMVAFTFFFPTFTGRALAFSAAVILGSGEAFVTLFESRKAMPALLRRLSFLFVGGHIFLYAVRIALILRYSGPDTRLMERSALATYTFALTSFYLVIWAGLILSIDAAGLLRLLEEKNRQLEGIATIDPLTGLFNRRHLDDRATAELERTIRYGSPLSLVMFDLDHFKRVNDAWGHQAGDEVLKEIGSLTRSFIREPDQLFRWGGEEFMVLAPHTDAEGAAVLAEKLRRTIETHDFPPVGRMAASFGVAQWRPAESLAVLFGHADFALYRAKNTGRNRVVVFDAEERIPAAAVKLNWREEWASGNAALDGQHLRILELANEILDHSLSGGGPERLGARMDALIEYIGAHFADEERLLADRSYPYLSAHAELHRKLEAEIRDLKARSLRGEAPPGVLLDFLVDRVVTDHFLKEDTKFFPFLGEEGLGGLTP